MKRVGFYGGSFNPPHAGHQATIFHALTTGQLDELVVAPVYKHPYNKELVDYFARMHMCGLLLRPFDTRQFYTRTSWIEKDAYEKFGSGYTADTINLFIQQEYNLKGERPHVVLIMGSDLREDIKKWVGYEQLLELCTRGWLSFFFVDRIPGLSSTAVRNAIANGAYVDRWLPREIHSYVFKSGLYQKKDSL